ncbi:hypothetical protein ACTMTF_15420 [Nonomuraea sp. ZG12]
MSAVVAVQSRILGVGKEQYDEGSEQKFERMSLQEVIQYAREEVEDGIAYNVMLRYKLNLLEKAVEVAFNGYQAGAGKHSKPEQVAAEPPVDNFTPPTRRPDEFYTAGWPELTPKWDELRDAARRVR